MKKLTANFALLAILAGSALAVGAHVSVNAKPQLSDSYYETTPNNANPPTKISPTAPALSDPSSHCGSGTENCVAEFNNTTGAYVSGTLIPGAFSN